MIVLCGNVLAACVGPTMMALCSFLLFVLLEDREFDPATAFTALSLFHLIATPFQMLPEMLAYVS